MLSNNISESSFSISTHTYFLGITALKPKSRQNLRKFKLFWRIFHPRSDNGCHWHLHTALWNIWWIINEPCGQFDHWLLALMALFFTSIFFFFFLHLCSKFSSSHSVKIFLCWLISRRIIAVRMSTCQSIKATLIKINRALLTFTANYMVIAQLIPFALPVNHLRQWT